MMSDDLDVTRIVQKSPEEDDRSPSATYQLENTNAVSEESFIETAILESAGLKKDADGTPPQIDLDFTHEYHLANMIGKGGQGEVWDALQIRLGRQVAVKQCVGASAIQENFLKEAFTSAQLDHPNIVPIHDLGTIRKGKESVPVISMKKIAGQNWHDLIREDKEKLSREDFLSEHLPIFLDVLNATAYAHSHHIIHRDLKPQQVMVGEFGEVYLLDWGLAVYVGDNETVTVENPRDTSRLYTLASASNPAGSPSYMAPEQAIFGTAKLGIHTDIYLLGAILFELVVGEPPHRGKTFDEVFPLAKENVCVPMPEDTPEDLNDIVQACLQTDPDKRPTRVADIITAVEKYLTGSSRKEASREITGKIAKTDLAELSTYEKLSDVSRELSQAAHHWSDNPDIDPCRTKVLERFAQVALNHGDFIIAQIQIGRIEDEDLKQELSQKVSVARDEAAKKIVVPPLLNKWRIALMVGSYAVIAFCIWSIANSAKSAVERELRNAVETLASVAAAEIRPSDINEVKVNRNQYSGEFQRILNQIGALRRSNGDVRRIHTFAAEPILGENTWRILVDADPISIDMNQDGVISVDEKGYPPGMLIESAPAEMAEAFKTKEPTSGPTESELGRFISGYAPIMDKSEAEPIALVGVDITVDKLEQKLLQIQRASVAALIVLIAIVSSAFIAYFSSKRALARIRLLESEIKKQSNEVSSKGLYLG